MVLHSSAMLTFTVVFVDWTLSAFAIVSVLVFAIMHEDDLISLIYGTVLLLEHLPALILQNVAALDL